MICSHIISSVLFGNLLFERVPRPAQLSIKKLLQSAKKCVMMKSEWYFSYSRREPNSHGFERQISAPAADKMLAISYIASHFLFASAKYLLAQNCAAPSGVEFFDGFCQSESKQDTHLARWDLAKDAKNSRRRAYEFGFARQISASAQTKCSQLYENNHERK